MKRRIYYFINGLLQIIDGLTFLFTAILNKPGTYFAYSHMLWHSKRELELKIKQSR